MYATEPEEYTRLWDMRGWHEHLKGERSLLGKEVESQQYIQDRDENLLQHEGPIYES